MYCNDDIIFYNNTTKSGDVYIPLLFGEDYHA